MKKKYFYLIVFSLIFIGFFIVPKNILLADECQEEYQCIEGCGGSLQKRSCCPSCCATDEEGNCTETCISCTSWETVQTCKGWETCQISSKSCTCNGSCLSAKNPKYYDNPEYSNKPNNSKDPAKIFLPVKLDWDDGFSPTDSSNGFIYYKITIDNANIKNSDLPQGNYSAILNKSEYNYRNDPNAGACFLNPSTAYTWHVIPCCNANGTNCQEDINKQLHATFTTAFAPEPISPYDPDWNGPKGAENVPTDVSLQWCSLAESKKYTTKEDCKNAYSESGSKYYWSYQDNACHEYSHQILIYLIENNTEICHPHLKTAEGSCIPKALKPFSPGATPDENYHPSLFSNKTYQFFTKNSTYSWQAATCKDDTASSCSELSQKWRFTMANFELSIIQSASPQNDPQGNSPVGFPVRLEWSAPSGSNSFLYELYEASTSILKLQGVTTTSSVSLDYPQLRLNTLYRWRIKSCWGYNGEADKCETNWSNFFYFKTTGQSPKLIAPENNAAGISIPVKLQWEKVNGAQSYILKFNDQEKIVDETEFILNYPEVLQEKKYNWQVKTCAKTGGQVCGNYSNSQAFTTFKLETPSNPKPENNYIFLTEEKIYRLSWKPVEGARAYQYEVEYTNIAPEEKSDECEKRKIISETTVQSTSVELSNLLCLGEYSWRVRACLSENCEENSLGNWSDYWYFNLKEGEASEAEKGGLIPCGQIYDNPKTSWNERESCQIKHIFVLIYELVDFFLWRIIPIILVLLVLASGAIFYFSLRASSPEPLAKVKSLWKAAGIGCGIIFLAWTLIAFVLTLFGYDVGIFGTWWKFNF